MENPTRKPKTPTGYAARWIKGYTYARLVGKKRTVHGTYRKIFRKIEVPAHWGFYKTVVPPSKRSAEKRRAKRITLPAWERANVYEDRLRREYDLAGSDPIYRFNRQKDVVKTGSGDFHGLVWDHPITADVHGDFDTGRVWYIAKHETQGETYLYVRTFHSEYGFNSLGLAVEERLKWEAAILAEYEGKEYMAVERFVAWTVFESKKRMGKNLHRGGLWKKRDTKEKAYATAWKRELRKPKTLKTRSGQERLVTRMVRREMTPWEMKKAIHELGGPRRLGIIVKKGESVQDAYRRLPPGDRRYYRRKLSRAVEMLEDRWIKERRGQ